MRRLLLLHHIDVHHRRWLLRPHYKRGNPKVLFLMACRDSSANHRGDVVECCRRAIARGGGGG